MLVKFQGKVTDCRPLVTTPGRFKLGDLMIGPDGMILEVATVQRGVPIWESNRYCKCVVIFRDETNDIIPVHGMRGEHRIYRPKKG